MVQGVNLEEVRKYNESLKQYRDKASQLKAEIDYNNKEIDTLCAELTTELGIQVTRENIEQVYAEQVNKINSTLQSGNAVLSKIASEESSASGNTAMPVQNTVSEQVVSQPVPQPAVQPVPQPAVQPAVQPVAQPAEGVVGIGNTPVTGGMSGVEQQAVAGSVFGNQPQASGMPTDLPKLF